MQKIQNPNIISAKNRVTLWENNQVESIKSLNLYVTTAYYFNFKYEIVDKNSQYTIKNQ